MCGFAGFMDSRASMPAEELRAIGGKMAATLAHRGPDDDDLWADARAGIVLGFRRLAILDLTAAGRQPMVSASGRYMIVFNGEIYNFAALRNELEGWTTGLRFRGQSDTEVLLAAIERWGLEEALHRFNGMFAFALWDRAERHLRLVRDRLGVKPVYYGWAGDSFLFGSELKALVAHPAFSGAIDREALSRFMRRGYIPSPLSIYQNIHKLPPGTILTVGAGQASAFPKAYWALETVLERARDEPFAGSSAEAVEQLDALLRDAVKLRMIADVPLGAFLSGGIDSSLVVALMQAQSNEPVRTFTIGFHEGKYNEAPFAKEVARHLGTAHTELYVTAAEAQGVIPLLPTLYDEPFADASQIPTCLISRLARQRVTVSLSGDGGDEIFGGYDRYLRAQKLWDRLQWMPRGWRGGLARALKWRPLPWRLGPRKLGSRIQKLADFLATDSPERLHEELVSHWNDAGPLLSGARSSPAEPWEWGESFAAAPIAAQMMCQDLVTYLPDDILVKMDRASMAIGLEAREPLLDHRLLEFAWRLPQEFKLRGGQGKWLLRRVLDRYVPRSLIERPKAGFSIPLADWLRGPLRPWVEALLDEGRLRSEGFFDVSTVRAKWTRQVAGSGSHEHDLWDVLMFQAWHEHWSDANKTATGSRRAG